MATNCSTQTVAEDSSSIHDRAHSRDTSVVTTDQMHLLDELQTQSRCDDKAADRGLDALHASRPEQIVISWEPDDPENPHNWPNAKKTFVLFIVSMLVINSTMGSSLPSMAVPAIVREFGVDSQEQQVLPISVYLMGYVVGPLIWGPLSEHLGRRLLTLATFVVYALFTMACALAPSWAALLIFRLVCGSCASAPISVGAGVLADIYGEPRARGRAFAILILTTTFGPLFSPIISGFVTPAIGWRWVFWIALIYAGLTLLMLVFLPETFAPVLLSRRARALRKERGSPAFVAPLDLEDVDLSQFFAVVLARPLRMLIFEPIVSSTCAYLALAYAILYMTFQAYPIVFQDLYGLSPGVAGLAYLPVGAGVCLALPVYWYWDSILQSATARSAPWTSREEYRRLPLACLGGPLFVLSLFWLGFSARPSVSFAAPMLSGVPFGLGFVLIFAALLNYLTDAYEVYAASANATASTCRSLLAVVLPLATSSMFRVLGISGACSLLGGLSALMCLIPFVFIWKGPSLRNRSPFCIALRQRKEEMLRKAEEERQRLERPAMRDKKDDEI